MHAVNFQHVKETSKSSNLDFNFCDVKDIYHCYKHMNIRFNFSFSILPFYKSLYVVQFNTFCLLTTCWLTFYKYVEKCFTYFSGSIMESIY